MQRCLVGTKDEIVYNEHRGEWGKTGKIRQMVTVVQKVLSVLLNKVLGAECRGLFSRQILKVQRK